ncbi:MAG TPA: M48 family metalloprotease, partial [Thermoanaerobaculia bacterium]|nr:M48 family metalloprotease [Thermoanaerobaculia bacterium]
MKHRILGLLAVVALLGALVAAQREHAEARPGAQSVLYLVADSERDLTTLPTHFTRLSDDDEAKYGGELAVEAIGTPDKQSSDDAQIDAVIIRVGGRVASQAHRRLLYQFHYLPDRGLINAFALPGGHVFIGRGLIEHMTTEDELATVLAHEVEHIDHYHCAERLQTELALRRIPLGGILAIPISVFQSGYSKDQELEADREGVLLAHRAGYSAAGAVRAFQMLRDLSQEKEQSVRTPQGELVSVATGVLAGYFRSHPATEDRIAQVRAMIAEDPSLAAQPERELSIESIFIAARALDAASREDFRTAADLAQRALRAHPEYPLALRALFEADLGLEQYAAAQEVFRQLVARDASVADAAERSAENRATELFRLGQYDRETRLIETLLVIMPSQPRLLTAAAWAYAMKGDDAAANAKAASLRLFYPNDASSPASEAERSAG